MQSILVIDDRADIRTSLRFLLEEHQYQVTEANSPQQAQIEIRQQLPALILLDMNFTLDTVSGQEGINFLQWMQDAGHVIPVIAMTAWSNTPLIVKAMQLGARDFIDKPWNNAQLINNIQRQLEISALSQQNSKLTQQLEQGRKQGYQWRSAIMQTLLSQLSTVAKTDANILLTGENGTGKSELAQFIHECSGKSYSSLVQVNMGAIPEALFESEMFGHVKGAFTDAKQKRIGRFELADQGSLFLDEIANMTLTQQAKLLRVLESGQYEAVGSSHTQNSNARIISATNCDLNQAIEQGNFREDLFYRLNTMTFEVPALRQRCDDVLPLAGYFVEQFTNKYHKTAIKIADDARDAMLDYTWPGNIREMSHLMERAVLLNHNGVISATDLAIPPSRTTSDFPLMSLEKVEQLLINRALGQSGNNVADAAEILGLTKSSLYRRMDKYGLGKS
ncbi:sigma-54-dependent transcriptional regulator [Neptunicella sp. SCSIO 80796]|uniref:sigma-54-dependent transcriptional regulator n=1 Tax=Neptunicella plasticusilytica TaxID=3117012 RepID=UPI003A4D5F92